VVVAVVVVLLYESDYMYWFPLITEIF
jgi:hypothetical protein